MLISKNEKAKAAHPQKVPWLGRVASGAISSHSSTFKVETEQASRAPFLPSPAQDSWLLPSASCPGTIEMVSEQS
jgi:hypothetical protein